MSIFSKITHLHSTTIEREALSPTNLPSPWGEGRLVRGAGWRSIPICVCSWSESVAVNQNRGPGRLSSSHGGSLYWQRLALGCLIAITAFPALAATPPPPSDLIVRDRPNDDGSSLGVEWTEPADLTSVDHYEISVDTRGGDGGFEKKIDVPVGTSSAFLEELSPDSNYLVRIVAVSDDGDRSSTLETTEPVSPKINWFNSGRTWLAILLALVCGVVLLYIVAARRGMKLWVRPIAGLDAVTDAVGRAVEMGKSVLFIPGIQDINDIQTVAGVTILSRVARIAAEYDAEIKVPTSRSLVMATARETVEASFLHAGRPDSYNPDDIYYLTDEQFGYVAGVTGQMVREKPAACFYMGSFYAESLILAETGNSIGSIQLAGTAQPSQLPFFIAACDYTLIGEEFFAASAYLSGEPQQLGSLKGQDFGKLLCAALIVTGCFMATIVALLATKADAGASSSMLAKPLAYLHDNVLGDEGFWPVEDE